MGLCSSNGTRLWFACNKGLVTWQEQMLLIRHSFPVRNHTCTRARGDHIVGSDKFPPIRRR